MFRPGLFAPLLVLWAAPGAARSPSGDAPPTPAAAESRPAPPAENSTLVAPAPAIIGERHPALELDLVDGTLVNEARLAGRPFVVDFFATWCEPCHRALADLLAVRASPSLAPLAIILVDLGESPQIVTRWQRAARLPAGLLVALDPSGMAARRWGARRLPTTYVVDAAGVVRHINRGWGPGYRGRMFRWLQDVAVPTAAPLPGPPPEAASPGSPSPARR